MKKDKAMPFKLSFMWVFILSLPIFFYFILFEDYSASFRMSLVTIAVLIYITLALLHHYFDKSLKVEIVIEYVLIGALALMIMQSFF